MGRSALRAACSPDPVLRCWHVGGLLRSIVCVLALLTCSCKDAQPGSPADGGGGSGAQAAAGGNAGQGGTGGSSSSGGGSGGGGSGGTGGIAPTPDFTNAASNELASPGEASVDFFGYAVALDQDTLVVGAYRDYASKMYGGAAHVYVPGGSGWVLQESLRPMLPEADSFFGSSVAVSGNTALAGAPSFTEEGPDVAGAAYFFSRSGSSWLSQQQVRETTVTAYAKFGGAVAVSGDRALIAAPNGSTARVYAYDRDGNGWSYSGELTADEPADQFGYALALDGTTALVGGLKVDGSSAAHVFVNSGGTWSEQARLVPGVGDAGFGFAVDLDGDFAVVGSEAETGTGAAYVYQRTGSEWQPTAVLKANGGAEGDRFGTAVAISGNVIVVGAKGHDGDGSESGAAYVFSRSGSDWAQQTKLASPSAAAGARFGTAVAIDGPRLAVGSVNAAGNGTVTVFEAPR